MGELDQPVSERADRDARARHALLHQPPLDAVEIITELVKLAKERRKERDRGIKLGLRDDELAFYGTVCRNDSTVLELGDDTPRAIAHDLVSVARRNATIDWRKKEQVRASLRRHIRRLLPKYEDPPDRHEAAVALVMRQAELPLPSSRHEVLAAERLMTV